MFGGATDRNTDNKEQGSGNRVYTTTVRWTQDSNHRKWNYQLT
jgi:hypothetical protein